MSTFTYRKRRFLSPVSTGYTSYVLAETESSDGGKYKLGSNILVFADCRRRVELEFFLGTARARRQSLAKLDLLLKVLTGFRVALSTESQLIADYDEKKQHRAKRSTKSH